MPPQLNRIGHVIGIVLVALVVVLSILSVAPSVIGAESSMVVQSNSMAPTMTAGDLILTKQTDPTAIDVGDVITFQAQQPGSSGYITHRVTGIETSDGLHYFQTQGDANDRPDPNPVPESAVLGEVWFVVPYVGHLIAFASSDLGIITFVIIPFSALVIVESIALYRDATTDRRVSQSTR